MRFLIFLLLLFLASCSNEQKTTLEKDSTQVTVSFGSSLASGALLPAGQVPKNVQKITLQPFSPNNTPLSSPIAFQSLNFNATFTVPNGNGIRIRAVAYNAANRMIYGGSSTPRNFTGAPQTVTILLNLNIELKASQTNVPRNGTVNIAGFVAGAPPLASSPLLWTTSGGPIAITLGSNGGLVTWTAPNTLGSYTVTANIDPAINPDQNANVTKSVNINVVNQPPVITAILTTLTLLEGTSNTTAITARDADADTVTLSLDTAASPANPVWATFNTLTDALNVSPPIGSSGIYPVVMVANDGFGGITKRTITVTVNPDVSAPIITLNAPIPNPVIITPGTVYTDPGAVVKDNVSIGLVATVTSTLNINTVGTYTLTYNATDAAGNTAIPVIRTVIVNNAPIAGLGNISFQEGVNGYFGSQDTELRMDIPTGNYGTDQTASIDGTTSSAAAGLDTYMLLQFRNIFGASPNQIPSVATIHTASLGVYMTSGGNNVDMLQILSPWQENTATWNSHATAVNTGTPLRTLIGRPTLGSLLNVSFSSPIFDVTTELQNWAAGISNFGWGLKPTNLTSIDGVTFATSEATVVANRPVLTVAYLANQRAVKTATNTNITLTLAGVDVDAQPLSATITSLPLNGSLFQTADGTTLGASITVVPTSVSSGTGQVIFVPTTAFAGQTSFNYVINDGAEDSLPASILVHVDAVAPTITLTGIASVNIPLNAVYIDAGATASDNVDGNITVNIVTNNPVDTTIAGLYTVTYDVFDAAGNAAIQAARTVKVNATPLAGAFTQTFRQGVNGYTGGQDTELSQSLPTANFGTSININIDGDSPVGSGSDVFAMMRFGGIFGAAQNQIPLNSNILNASLNLYLSSGGHHVDMLQMTLPWTDTTATWNTHNTAVTGGTLLRTLVGRPIAGSPLNLSGTFPAGFDVSTEVQAWSNGASNFGWGFKPFNLAATDGVIFGSHDRPVSLTTGVTKRPKLTVIYQNPAFTVSTAPNTNITITLGGYDANNDPLTSKITILPLAGALYQTADGITLGAPITVVPATVSNANQQVIFVPATGTAGQPYASFDFVVNDGSVDSLPASVTINVIPAATTISAANGNATITTGANCNTVWSVLGSPYIITSPVIITPGCRLQIDPYTTLKFNSGTGITVQATGTLDIYGAATTPVVMTTVNDDTVAPILAISNGTPAIGSWAGIVYQSASLGSISDTQVHYATNALDISNTSPTITNFTATEFGGIGLYLHSNVNQNTSPTVTNIVLSTTDTLNQPIYMLGSAVGATSVVAPVINGTSITTASTSTNAGAIQISGIGVNPSISNMTINGGGYNLLATNSASGVFTNNILNGATTSAIYLANGASSNIDFTNTVQNTPAAYELVNQLLPAVASPLLGFFGTNVKDPLTLRVTGTLPASVANYIMSPDPLGLGSSVYQIIGNLNVASGARLIINAGTVIKSAANSLIVNSGGTLDIYGSLFQPVIFTSIKDDTVAGDTNFDGLLTSPASREGVSLNYQAGSLGSISFFDMKYSDGFTVSSAIPMNDVSRFKGGFGMKFSGTMNQTVSNLHIDHDGIGGDTALYISGIGTNPIFTGNNTVDKYSGIHDGVIIQTGASPTFQNFTIDMHGANQPGLAIYDAATVVTVKNNTIQNADKAVLIANGASPIINNNIIRNSNTGVYLALWYSPVLGQAGNATITHNKIVGNNTGIYVHNTTSAIIEHNLIRTNANIGVTIDALQTLPVTLQNNLIVENGTGLLNNGGVRLLDDPVGLRGANVSLLSNTITNNLGTGLSIDAYATAMMNDNIIANNTVNFSVVPLALAGDYNLTDTATFPSVGPNITGVIPQFAKSWYLSDATALNGNTAISSPAINASSIRTPVGVGYLTQNPYAQTALADINQLDIGYHHATPDVTASLSSIGSTVVADTLLPGIGGNVVITITPNILQSGLELAATITSLGNTVGAVSLANDLGDGTYQVIFTASTFFGGKDSVNITANGIPLGPTGLISW